MLQRNEVGVVGIKGGIFSFKLSLWEGKGMTASFFPPAGHGFERNSLIALWTEKHAVRMFL
nr:hypothetical protein [Mechercharimyces sp. CAU 1602]